MRKAITLALVLVFGISLVFLSVDAKPRYGVSVSKSNWRNVHSWLGVYTQSVDEELADAFDIGVDYGAIVNEVIEDSPADDAGLKNGDVIISFDGNKVWDKDDLVEFIEDTEPGTAAELVVLRKGEEVTLNVDIGKRPRTTVVAPSPPSAPQALWYHDSDEDDGDVRFFAWGGSGFVGISMTSLSDQLGEYFGVENGEGVLITGVEKDSPAEKAGLKAGDVITKIDNKSIRKYNQVKEIVSESNKGDQLEFTIVRNKRTQNIKVEVDEMENSGYNYGIYSVPPIPDINVQFPRGIGRFNFDDENGNTYFDYDQYKESMEKFREDMKKYKEEMKEFSKELKQLKREDRSELEDQIKELKEQIRELERKIQ